MFNLPKSGIDPKDNDFGSDSDTEDEGEITKINFPTGNFKFEDQDLILLLKDVHGDASMLPKLKESITLAPSRYSQLLESFKKKKEEEKEGIGDQKDDDTKKFLFDFLYCTVSKITFEELRKLRLVMSTFSVKYLKYFLLDIDGVNGVMKLHELVNSLDYNVSNSLRVFEEIINCLECCLKVPDGIKSLKERKDLLVDLIYLLYDETLKDLSCKKKILDFFSLLIRVDKKEEGSMLFIKCFSEVFEREKKKYVGWFGRKNLEKARKNYIDGLVTLLVQNTNDMSFLSSGLMFINIILATFPKSSQEEKKKFFENLFESGIQILMKQLEFLLIAPDNPNGEGDGVEKKSVKDEKEKEKERASLKIQIDTFGTEILFFEDYSKNKNLFFYEPIELLKKVYLKLKGKKSSDYLKKILSDFYSMTLSNEYSEEILDEKWKFCQELINSLAQNGLDEMNEKGNNKGSNLGVKMNEKEFLLFQRIKNLERNLEFTKKNKIEKDKKLDNLMNLLEKKKLDDITKKDILSNSSSHEDGDFSIQLFKKIKKIIKENNKKSQNDIIELKRYITKLHNSQETGNGFLFDSNISTSSDNSISEINISGKKKQDEKNVEGEEKIEKKGDSVNTLKDDDDDDDDDEAPLPPPCSMDEVEIFNEFEITNVFNKNKDLETKTLKMKRINREMQKNSLFFQKGIVQNCHKLATEDVKEKIINSFPVKKQPRKKIFQKNLSKVYLVNEKTTYQAEIALRTVECDNEEIISRIKKFDTNNISIDDIDKIQKVLPTKEELKKLKTVYNSLKSNQKKELSSADLLFFELSKIPNVNLRLKTWLFSKRKYQGLVDFLFASTCTLFNSCNLVLEDNNFHTFLKYLLVLGNVLNSKNPVYSFEIKTLNEISFIKTTDERRISIIQFILEIMLEKDEKSLNFIDVFKNLIDEVKEMEISNLEREFENLKKEISNLIFISKEPINKEDKIVKKLKKVIVDGKFRLIKIEENLEKIRKQFKHLSTMFGEKISIFESCDFWVIFGEFISNCEHARNKIKLEKEKEKKRLQREEKFSLLASVSDSYNDLSMIQKSMIEGNFFKRRNKESKK